jgi:PAS domain S-box-containing protein
MDGKKRERRRAPEQFPSGTEQREDKVPNANETLKKGQKEESGSLRVLKLESEGLLCRKDGPCLYRTFVESINEGAATLTADGTVLYCNRRFAEILQQPFENVLGEDLLRLLDPETRERIQVLLREGLKGSTRREVDLRARDGSLLLSVLASCQRFEMDGLHTVCILLTDLSERKRAEAELRQAYERLKASEEELREQAAELDRKNLTMRELIGQISLEKRRIREDVTANIRDSVLPILEKFRVEDGFAPHVKAIRRILEDLTSPYSRELARIGAKLTMKEMDICRMIKGGLTSKEIAESLNVSPQTVEKHRKSIRKKLGIANRAVDLGSYLNQL